MRAVIWSRYGGTEGLEVADVEDPVPKDDEIRIRVRATTVTAGDCEVRSLKFRFPLSVLMRFYVGLHRPKRIRILGQELAGVIESIGKDVTGFCVGDHVFAHTDFTMGAHAEYRCFPSDPGDDEGMIAHKPANLSFEEAAALPLGGLEALKYLREAAVRPGERVLIVGSAGSIGTVGIQLAKHFGAEVTGVDSGDKLETMRECGADHAIDYTAEDFTHRIAEYDVVFDVVGKAPFRSLLGMLRENGRLILANPKMVQMLRGGRTFADGKRVITGTKGRPDDLLHIHDLAEAGVVRPIVDRTFPLEEMAEAHRYVESGAKKGSLVITIGEREP